MKGLMWGLFEIWNGMQNMTWQISVVIFAVIICRFFINKVSKQACYLLWLIVAVRLICLSTIESDFSIFNVVGENRLTEMENVAQETVLKSAESLNVNESKTDVSHAVIAPDSVLDVDGTLSDNVNNNVSDEVTVLEHNNALSAAITAVTDVKLIEDKTEFLIWIVGVFCMLAYGIISYTHLKYKLRFATKTKEGYFESEAIASPFVFGILKPVIYMPLHLSEQEKTYILSHERYHIKRRDYLVKIMAFGLLSVYWFHPFVWLAFYLMSQDMEMSCDEQVLKALGAEERKAYSTLLLSFAQGKKIPLIAPLSFGESNVKSRIRQILQYKKPTIWAIAAIVVVMVVVGISCLTDASKAENKGDTDNVSISSEEKYDKETGLLSDAYLMELATQLYEAKNTYIGDMPANGQILKLLKEALEISNTNGTELQTLREPYWITLGFDEKPDDEAMFHMATMFLTLVDNATEFRWEFYDENYGRNRVFYVNLTNVNLLLGYNLEAKESIKDFSESPEKIIELWRILEQKREETTSDESRSSLAEESNWKYIAQQLGFDMEQRNEWELRFIEDDLLYNYYDDNPDIFSIRDVKNCFYEDFDENGQMDLAVLISGYYGEEMASRLFFYMNESTTYTYGRKSMYYCFGGGRLLTGDIDHDGCIEFVFYGNTGGNGGASSYYKDIFKYKDGFFEEVPWIGDYNSENSYEGEMGFELEVRWGEEMDTYDIVCPSLGVTKTVYSPYLRDENGELYHKPNPGVLTGGNCRGFHTLEIVEENGKEYLIGTEILTGDGGNSHCFADARFVFDWDDTKGWIVKDFDVISFDYDADTDAIFDAMKLELKYLPSNYDAIVEAGIPIINYKKNQIIDPYERLSDFARNRQQYTYDESITYVAWNANEEPIYVRLTSLNGIYYYMEDYTRLTQKPEGLDDYGYAVYSDDIYTVQKSGTGEYIEYFYLTNEPGVTLDELQQSLLSSVTPSTYDVTPIYHKALDEIGLTKYMNLTGDILDLDMQISLPENDNWIQEKNYSVFSDAGLENALAKVEYYDGIIFADMTLLAGNKENVFENTDITAYIDNFTAETWSAWTANKVVSISFYMIPIDDVYKMPVALWEYEGDTYLLYGKTAAGDCSSVAKTAIYIIEHFDN